jgi:hypothetical protein
MSYSVILAEIDAELRHAFMEMRDALVEACESEDEIKEALLLLSKQDFESLKGAVSQFSGLLSRLQEAKGE